MSNILVTGGAGSMGRLVSEQLLEKGHFVNIFDLPTANFEGFDNSKTKIFKGNLNDASIIEPIKHVDTIIHLAAILPPTANTNIELAKKVNVEGTNNLIKNVEEINPDMHLIFSSSVSIYGKNFDNSLIDQHSPINPDDNYAQTKYDSEVLVEKSKINSTILRISGVSIPVFQEPPSEWPFLPNQQIEFIHRDDVVTSICNSVGNKEAYNQILNISGGNTWQITGEKYVKDYFEILEVEIDNAIYQKDEGHFSWYESEKSNRILQYQKNTYENYLSQIRQDLSQLMGE
ncbi:MAG: NAD(P)-dependent oxidoreductase [Chloroflexota bacterium]|nr:NAD(P)-dependent oxidoreductase [Chloroflexota bacterium]